MDAAMKLAALTHTGWFNSVRYKEQRKRGLPET